ncbi:rhomboid family intramembrane serine protease [Maribellus luteus]|uniref:Rhomboid family intramembrane serine protease n=1 Tax=Maribellus luteus TaxID=2305463 RepID=A0A399SVZ8_9BACT|nr:rhomboid family intramembrane serine protease [Maribellus luteus]RIJ46265.1 rhomboid family intramembrane serine protease [Maribellus luteus]
MKAYIKSNWPKLSVVLVGLFFITGILSLTIPAFGKMVLLYSSNLAEPLNWYRLLTYPLYGGGLLNWAHNALVMVLTGFILENRISKKEILAIIVLSAITGGLLFIFLNQNAGYDLTVASPVMISWGYCSATIVIGLKCWGRLNVFEKVVVIMCLASLLSVWNDNIGFLVGQISVITIIGLVTLIRFRGKELARESNPIE